MVMNVFRIDGLRAVLAGMMMCMASTTIAQDLDAKYAANLLPVGTKAPDLIDPLDSIHRIDDFHGRCVVLDFFLTENDDFRKDLSEMKKLFQVYDMAGLEFLGVSLDNDPGVLQNFMDKESIPWGVISEMKKMEKTRMAKDYRIQHIPTLYLLDTEGRVLLATVEINKLKAKLAELKKANKLVAPELAGQDHAPQYPGGVPEGSAGDLLRAGGILRIQEHTAQDQHRLPPVGAVLGHGDRSTDSEADDRLSVHRDGYGACHREHHGGECCVGKGSGKERFSQNCPGSGGLGLSEADSRG